MLWDWVSWVIESLPLNISVELHLLDDDEFVAEIFGDIRGLSNLYDDDKDQYLFENSEIHFVYLGTFF